MTMRMLSVLLMMVMVAVSENPPAPNNCGVDTLDICYNYHNNSHVLLENQVNLEMKASYFYQIYGTYFDRSDIALPGLSEYFLRESLHEHTHADNLLRYINQRGGRPAFKDIQITDICAQVKNKCFCRHIVQNQALACLNPAQKTIKLSTEKTIKKVGLWALEDALKIEQLVTIELTRIVAESSGDHQLTHYIEHEYLDEQIQTTKRLGSFVGQLGRLSDQEYVIGEYNFDNNLFKKVKRTAKMNAEHRDKAVLSSHYQWHEERQEYDSLYI